MNLIYRVFKTIFILGGANKRELFILYFLAFLQGLTDVFSTGLLITFVISESFGSGINIDNSSWLKFFLLDKVDSSNFALLICLISIIAHILKIFLTRYIFKRTSVLGNRISMNILRRILNTDYYLLKDISYSRITDTMYLQVNQFISGSVTPSLLIFSFMGTLFSISTFLLLQSPLSIVIALPALFILQLFVFSFVKFRLKKRSSIYLEKYQSEYLTFLQSFIKDPRDILLNFNNEKLIKNIATKDKRFRDIITSAKSYVILPKLYLEFFIAIVIIILIAFFAKTLFDYNPNNFYIIIILGIVKIMPALNGINSSVISMKAFESSTNVILDFYRKYPISQKSIYKIKNKEKCIYIKKEPKIINLKNIFFKYKSIDKEKDVNIKKDYFILKNFNLEIKSKEKVLIKGESGSGKSTLIDIILCLLKPSKGSLLYGGKNLHTNFAEQISFQNQIGFISQNQELRGSNLKEVYLNHNLNIQKIDRFQTENIKKLLYKLKLEKIPLKDNNFMNLYFGDGLNKLSGGQRSRILISTLLTTFYPIIIMDEPTSSLDKKTELFVMKNVLDLLKNSTVIIVSHSDKFDNLFDKVIDLNKI